MKQMIFYPEEEDRPHQTLAWEGPGFYVDLRLSDTEVETAKTDETDPGGYFLPAPWKGSTWSKEID